MDIETKKETFIPMHRVLEIWMDDKIGWKKRLKGKPGNPKSNEGKKAGKGNKKLRRKASSRKRRGNRAVISR